MSGANPAVLQVVILRDGLLVGTEVFVPGVYTIGSGRAVDLRLDDAAVGDKHAFLYFKNGKAAVQDTGASTRGVYVNGHRVNACEVRPVDEIACGPFVLKVRVLTQRPEEKPAVPAEVAALLGSTPASGAMKAAPQDPRTAFSARKLAQLQQPPQPPVASPPPAAAARAPEGTPRKHLRPRFDSGKAVEEFFREENPTIPHQLTPTPLRNEAVARAPVPPIAAPHPKASPAEAPWPELWPTPAPKGPADAPTIGVQLEQLQPAPKPATSTGHVHANVTGYEPEPVPTNGPVPDPVPEPVRKAAGEPKPKRTPDRKPSPAKPPKNLRLYLEAYWHQDRQLASSFRPTAKKPLIAGEREDVPVPLYGFGLEEAFPLATPAGGGYLLKVPPGAKVERGPAGGPFQPVRGESSLTLVPGEAARLSSSGGTSLLAYVAPPPKKEWVNPLRGLPYLMLVVLGLCFYGFGAFLYYAPKTFDDADFVAKDLPKVAVRLIAPEPKRKERVQKNLAAMAKRQEKRKKATDTPAVVESSGKPKPTGALAQNKALQAISKLAAAGPAAGDILAAVDKQGNGPGSKTVKKGAYSLTGLIGKGVAAPGTGTFGLGGGGTGKGYGTAGSELLKGRGGGGIGALGAGGVGRGAVGGTVARASARTIASSGSIDREAVAKVVNEHLHEVSSCYERALLKDPGLSGKVVLEWTIASTGKVAAVKTKTSTLRSSAVEGCIMSALKKWVFPSPRGGQVIITYPFLFNSVGF